MLKSRFKKKIILTFSVLAVLILVFFFIFKAPEQSRASSLSCQVSSGSCSGTTVFKIYSTSNAHAELYGQANYNYYVCCSGISDLDHTCSDATVLKLSSSTNAHVEKGTLSNYTNNVCLSSTIGNISCGFDSNCANLGSDYICLASISADTNAHVGDCNAYSTKVCCKYVGPPSVSTNDADQISDTTARLNGEITALNGENASERGFDWDIDSGTPYANSWTEAGSYGVGSFNTTTAIELGKTYYFRAKAKNSVGWGYGAEKSFTIRPAPPTGVSATDGTYKDKVTVTWTKPSGATGYRVYRDDVQVGGDLGDVSSYDDTGAAAPTITPGSVSSSDGTYLYQVVLSSTGASANTSTPAHVYKVKSFNIGGASDNSNTDTGYRGVGALNYQWQRSEGDSDGSYSDISGATTQNYNDTGAPENGAGRYYKCVLTAEGAASQTVGPDRGYRMSIETHEASNVLDASATLWGELAGGSGTVNHRGFDWGETTSYGQEWFESGSYSPDWFSHGISGLNVNVTYHFRAKVCDGASCSGETPWIYGGDKTFTTYYIPPQDMGVNGYECGKLKVSWCGHQDMDGYLIYHSLFESGCSNVTSSQCALAGYLGEGLDDNGLKGHWKLNETSGATVIDSSGNGNDGTNYGATRVDGKFRKALDFDGGNDYVSVPYGDFVNESFSWSGWIKIDTNDYRMITDDRNTSSWNGWYIRHRGDLGAGSRIFDFYVKNASGQTGIIGTTQPNLGQWYHLVVTYEYIGNGTSKMNMYVNGAKDATEITNAYGVDAASADNRIGCHSGGGGAWVDGTIDNVAIYNRVLTPQEVRKMYEASPLSSSCAYTCNTSKYCNPMSPSPGTACCNTNLCSGTTCLFPDIKAIPGLNYYYRTVATVGAERTDPSSPSAGKMGKTICVPPSLMREK